MVQGAPVIAQKAISLYPGRHCRAPLVGSNSSPLPPTGSAANDADRALPSVTATVTNDAKARTSFVTKGEFSEDTFITQLLKM